MTHPLVGKSITGVYLATDGGALRFDLAPDGDVPARPGTRLSIIARADGDCCSRSWIEGFDNPTALIGRVQSVDDIDMPDRGNPNDYDVIRYYGCKVTTDKGACVIDYRNSSNGYYGGSLVWPGPDAYFYGGVFDQNQSTLEWKNIA